MLEEKNLEEDSITKIDFRVGLIEKIEKHENSNNLYIEQVSFGEENKKTVVSSLVQHIEMETLKQRLAVFVYNMKPVSIRGVSSEAMIFVASDKEYVEIPTVPEGSVPGDRVIIEGLSFEPVPKLNPKKKIFEEAKKNMFVKNGVLFYKEKKFIVEGKGVLSTKTIINGELS